MTSYINFYRKHNPSEDLKIQSGTVFSNIKNLPSKWSRVDLDVFLASKDRNLQRPFVWTDFQCQELIMSILIGRTIPPISYISLIDPDGGSDFVQVIDGKQRLMAIYQFITDCFEIEIDGVSYFYSNLPSDFKMKINSFTITANIMYQNFDNRGNIIAITDEQKIGWFKFLNFSGTPIDVQHLDGL